jgi:hypothetical protein
MNRLAELLGSSTRANIVQALALSDKPLTAYRLARRYNMNVAKVYLEMKRLEGLGLLKLAGTNGKREYLLVDVDLQNLALRLSPRVQTYESWRSDESRRERFRMGLAAVPRSAPGGGPNPLRQGKRRFPGELENLAVLGRRKFDSKYRKTAGRSYARV